MRRKLSHPSNLSCYWHTRHCPYPGGECLNSRCLAAWAHGFRYSGSLFQLGKWAVRANIHPVTDGRCISGGSRAASCKVCWPRCRTVHYMITSLAIIPIPHKHCSVLLNSMPSGPPLGNLFDKTNFCGCMNDKGRAYRYQAMRLISICRNISLASMQHHDQDDELQM